MQAYQIVQDSTITKKNIPQLVDAVVYKIQDQWNKEEKDFSLLDTKLEESQQLYAQFQAQQNLSPEKIDQFSGQLAMI